ncbi:GNAT family N-acetyltransferase [Pontivivens insulae]|uniref:N-acetyltransferase domain-containing protein n=1 Tax=Pontivivens insulae TaxID=1639689 RepID=A0A2R8A7U4_9RHOB|nr:GNAT family N-acetyltransferase [Pontivivens insulae]RED18210.1 hypothetical protein DFR53_0405 [Pontivivens insulae]SPF28108.1 hypothetical protein POI8812_00406 [Pontivivens insulae]
MADIRREEEGSHGRYVLTENGVEAEMAFTITSPKLRIVDHTGVPDALRGTGAGRRMAEQLVADARAEGWKIIPLCPFVNAERRKHPDWADVFQV